MAVRVAARRAGSMVVSPGGLGVRWKADCCTERVVAWLDRGLVGRLAAGLRMAHSLLPGIQSKMAGWLEGKQKVLQTPARKSD